MNMFKRILRKREAETQAADAATLSPDDIADIMHDKELSFIQSEVVRVIYSRARTERYVILKDERGLYSYHLEILHAFDEETKKFTGSTLPGTWDAPHSLSFDSRFDCLDDLKKELTAEPIYQNIFETDED